MHTRTGLYQLFDRLLVDYLPSITNRKSFVVNDISNDIQIHADRKKLTFAFENILETALRYTKNDCIRISASSLKDNIQITLKENRQRSYFEMEEAVEELESLAKETGACITINSNDNNGSIISFSFYNRVNAAG